MPIAILYLGTLGPSWHCGLRIGALPFAHKPYTLYALPYLRTVTVSRDVLSFTFITVSIPAQRTPPERHPVKPTALYVEESVYDFLLSQFQ